MRLQPQGCSAKIIFTVMLFNEPGWLSSRVLFVSEKCVCCKFFISMVVLKVMFILLRQWLAEIDLVVKKITCILSGAVLV